MTDAAPSATDVLIVGAGIAGASLAAALAPWRRVTLLEAEDAPGYHATGRSAAFWHESYGGARVQPLTRASFETLDHPSSEFSDRGFLTVRRALTLGRASDSAAVDAFAAEFAAKGVAVERMSGAALARHIPGLRPLWSEAAFEAACCDIDVGRLHTAYLRAAKRAGASLVTRTPFRRARRVTDGWQVETDNAVIHGGLLVNAAGAWADRVAAASGIAPIGIQPYRRTMLQLRLDVPVPAELPLVIDIGGSFYFKGESVGRVWLTPHDETPVDPHDVVPEDIDVAIAIDRLQSVVDWPIATVERKWAGLRSFAPDRLPVFGADRNDARFIWCAGQGGFGIQTAPAIAGLLAAQLGAPEPAGTIGRVDPAPFAPSRFG